MPLDWRSSAFQHALSSGLQLGIPPSVQHYHSLYPLEPPAASATEAPGFGVRSQVLKGISDRTGSAFALRRISPQQVLLSLNAKPLKLLARACGVPMVV